MKCLAVTARNVPLLGYLLLFLSDEGDVHPKQDFIIIKNKFSPNLMKCPTRHKSQGVFSLGASTSNFVWRDIHQKRRVTLLNNYDELSNDKVPREAYTAPPAFLQEG